jgi:hypothetical protein
MHKVDSQVIGQVSKQASKQASNEFNGSIGAKKSTLSCYALSSCTVPVGQSSSSAEQVQLIFRTINGTMQCNIRKSGFACAVHYCYSLLSFDVAITACSQTSPASYLSYKQARQKGLDHRSIHVHVQ